MKKTRYLKNSALAKAIELVLEYRTNGYCDFVDRVPGDDYFEFYLKISHSTVVSTITSAHNIVNTYMLEAERNNRIAWITQFGEYNEKHSELLNMIFERNRISKSRWVRDLCNVLNECDQKKNTLFMFGTPNSGKTLLCRLICEAFTCGYISLQGCAGVFYFESALNKSILGIDELWVIPGNADTWKCILGGNEFDCPKKNMVAQRMARTPCIVTSNFAEMGRGFLDKIDETALRTRMYRYNFTCDISDMMKDVIIDMKSFAYWLSVEIKGLP